MRDYCRIIACCFLFLPFLSSANSTFTSLSQTSSHPFSGHRCVGSEKTALLRLKRDLSAAKPESPLPLQPASGSLLTSWKPDTDCCSWEGVTCHGVTTDHVVGIKLRGHNLSGLVNSTEFLDLPYLERLNLVNCNIGEIPSFLQKVGRLVELDLSNNNIHGEVPKWIWQFERLVYLNLSNNFLNGFEAPSSGPFSSSLTFLDLSSNLLEGSIPILPPSVSFLSLAKNKLTGEIPESLCRIRNLTILDLCYNSMTGEIPEEIGDLKLLEVLNISRNNLKGEIPTSLSKLTLLESLDLSENKLTGAIPMQLISLTFLSVLNLSYNRLEGTIPVGNQFSTFTSDSYQENLGLCGFPLSNKCDDVEDQQPPGAQEESILSEPGSLFSWKFALLGYGCAVPVGVAIGHMLFWRNMRCSKWIEQSFKAKNHRRQSNERNRKRR
ncbi:hypothetical protein NC652_028378 [Populus alba x Populus x berolinensis]|nr:hypothetical protein NC652_028378 [Populus alba x Populus x berolinensis]